MTKKLEFLSIEFLRITSKKRRGVSAKRVEELRVEIEEGAEMTPIRVRALGDGTYVVKDGRHRIQAHLEAGISVIAAVIEDLATRMRNFWRKMRHLTPRVRFFYSTGSLGVGGKTYRFACRFFARTSLSLLRTSW